MKIALIGYGKMGHIIEQIALSRGHEIVSVIDKDNQKDFTSEAFRMADVAIEFSAPAAACSNVRKAWEAGVPVVSGTTGWEKDLEILKHELLSNGKGLFWASNYSIGVNLFMKVNRYLAQLMNDYADYDVNMTEVHHIHKLDAPSGTAITLANDLLKAIDRKREWVLGEAAKSSDLSIMAVREGEVPGIHTISYDSEVDTITITHSAKSRRGFALGAVMAAEFLCGKKGFYGMEDLLGDKQHYCIC